MIEKDTIKGLECCTDKWYENCNECPYSIDTVSCERMKLLEDSLDLINHKQELLEATIAGQETLQKALAKKEREIERLTAEKERLIKTFGECQTEATKALDGNDREIERMKNELFCLANEHDSISDCINEAVKKARAEVIRGFGKRLKDVWSDNDYDSPDIDFDYFVDTVIKEMAGEM